MFSVPTPSSSGRFRVTTTSTPVRFHSRSRALTQPGWQPRFTNRAPSPSSSTQVLPTGSSTAPSPSPSTPCTHRNAASNPPSVPQAELLTQSSDTVGAESSGNQDMVTMLRHLQETVDKLLEEKESSHSSRSVRGKQRVSKELKVSK